MVVVAEYIWLDVKKRLRSKTKVIHNINYEVWSEIVNLPAQKLADKFPEWNYDGSSTGQAEGLNSELILKPVAVYYNPFSDNCTLSSSFLVLCETLDKNSQALPTNTRAAAADLATA